MTVPAKAVDVLGHANNTAYVRWMQDAALKHSAHVGWGWERYVESGAAFVVRRQVIDYLRPLKEGAKVEIATWVVSMAQSASIRATEIRAAGGEVALRAETTWIFIALETGRPVSIPEEIRAAFAVKATTPRAADER